MTYSNRGGFDRGNYGNRNGQDRGYDRPQMFQATCDQCGKSCEVPFRPNGSKPIYCSSCFEAKGGNGFDRQSERRFDRNENRERRDFSPRPQFVAPKQSTYIEEFNIITRKLDKIIDMLSAKTDLRIETTKKIKKAIKETKEAKLEADATAEA